MGKWKRGLSGFLAVVLGLSAMQGDILYASAADLVEKLTAEISDGDVNGDGKTNSADVEALQTLLSSTVGSISASGKGQYDVYHDGNIDVRDLLAVQQLVDSKTPQKPEQEASGETIKLEVTDTECCPGEEVTVDVRMIDWNQDIGAIALTLDFDSSLSLKEVACTGSYQYVSDGNVLKIYGIPVKKDVYRGTVATLTFTVPDTAYGDYDVKIKDASLYNSKFQALAPTTEVGLIAADVTERPLYLNASYINSASMRLSWSMPYCSGSLEGYIVYRDGEEIARTVDPYYYDKELTNNQKYTYSVQAYGADNYQSAKSKEITAAPQNPEISAVAFPDNASVIGGTSTYVKCTLARTVDAASYSLSYVDFQGEQQTIFSGSDLAFSTTDIKWNIKELPSGKYDLIFSVTDQDGASAEKTVSVTVDTTPPEQVFGFDVFEGEQQMQLTWGIATEAKVVGYNIYRRTETSNYSLLAYVDGRDKLEYIDDNLEEGAVYFYIMCAVDQYGQEGIYSEEKSAAAKGDETAPEITLFLPTSGTVLHHTVTLSLKAEDNIGIASISAFLSTDDGATWTELFHGKGASINYQFDTTAYTEEQVKIKAVAYDYAGNESEGLVHIYAIDNQGPSQIEGIQSVAVTAVTATLSWADVPDEDFSYFSVRYGKPEDEANWKTIHVSTTLGVNLTDLTPDTAYCVCVAAVDRYGNIGTYSEPFLFQTISDTIAPAVLTMKPNPGYYRNSLPLIITARDDFQIAKVTIQAATSSEEDEEWTNLTVIENDQQTAEFQASYALPLASYPDGTIYIRAFAEDAAGNIGEPSARYEYIVDQTAPDAPTSLTASSDANTIELSWEAYQNNLDSVAFSLYRNTEQNGTYTCILEKANVLHYYDRSAEPETKYFYKLTAIDAAENESAQSEAVSAILEKDTEAPKIVSVSPEDGGTVSTAQKTISVLVSDNVKLSSVTIAYRLSDDADYKVFSKANSIDNYYIVAEGTLPKAALSGDRVQIQSLCS